MVPSIVLLTFNQIDPTEDWKLINSMPLSCSVESVVMKNWRTLKSDMILKNGTQCISRRSMLAAGQTVKLLLLLLSSLLLICINANYMQNQSD